MRTAQRAMALSGGFDMGPLFAPIVKTATRPRRSGGAVVWEKYSRALPLWATHAECAEFWRESRAMTAATGVQHSVDHIVPLVHPLVCGLHCPANLRVIPLADNQAKGNAWWPDMPESQLELIA